MCSLEEALRDRAGGWHRRAPRPAPLELVWMKMIIMVIKIIVIDLRWQRQHYCQFHLVAQKSLSQAYPIVSYKRSYKSPKEVPRFVMIFGHQNVLPRSHNESGHHGKMAGIA